MSIFTRRSQSRGFTLIELLVVIAIIGILSSVVLASLNSARQKGRDARRLSDVKQIQLALELYYDANGAYPATIGSTSSSPLVSGGYIATLPVDPTNNAVYTYVPYAVSGSTGICSSYHLGTSLETTGNTALGSDADITSIPSGYVLCTAAGSPSADFSGTDNAHCATGDAGSACYDVKA